MKPIDLTPKASKPESNPIGIIIVLVLVVAAVAVYVALPIV